MHIVGIIILLVILYNVWDYLFYIIGGIFGLFGLLSLWMARDEIAEKKLSDEQWHAKYPDKNERSDSINTLLVFGVIFLGLCGLSLNYQTESWHNPELIAQEEAEKQKKLQEEEQAKIEKEQAELEKKLQENLERANNLSGEEKNFYDTKFQEYLNAGNDENSSREKSLADVDEMIRQKQKAEQERIAAEEKKLAEEKAAQEKLAAEQKAEQAKLAAEQKKAQEEQEKIAKAKEKIAGWEQSGKLKYQRLPDGSANVILTEQADYKLHGAKETDKLELLFHDEHERNALKLASQSMILVQEVKEAGVQANNFEIHLRGNTIDSEGYKSVGDVMICEISGNKNWEKNDYYEFYNSTSRFWMIDGL